MDLTELTAQELDKLTKAELIAAILEDVTYSDVNLVKDEYGNNVELTETVKDAYGKVVSSRVITWTYYDAKEGTVDEIITEDAKERVVVKHYIDGRQPIAIKKPIEPIPIPREL